MQAKTEKADVVDGKKPLCTLGRDEKYIRNRLWILGASCIVLEGVGDGMIAWCALELRIPILCMYDRVLHKTTIEKFLQDKVAQKMKTATPADVRWYRTDSQLCCRQPDDEAAAKKAKTKAKAKAKVQATAEEAAEATEEAKAKATKRTNSSSSSASSSSSSASKKSKKAKTEKKKEEA